MANFLKKFYTHLKPPNCPDMTLHKKFISGIIRRGIIKGGEDISKIDENTLKNFAVGGNRTRIS